VKVMKRVFLIIIFTFLYSVASDFVEVTRVLRSDSTVASQEVYDWYVVDYCARVGTLLEITVSNLGFRDHDVVYAWGGPDPYPTSDNFTKGWTTVTSDPAKPADSFEIVYPGKPVFLSITCGPFSTDSRYNIVVTASKQPDNKKWNKATLYGDNKTNQKKKKIGGNYKFLKQTFQAIVNGSVGFAEEKYFSFPICKNSIPPGSFVSFSSHITGQFNSCGFNQYLGNSTNVSVTNYLPKCVDRTQNTPSYISCDRDNLGRWNYAYVPDILYLLVMGYGGNGKDYQNQFQLSACLLYSQN